MEMHTHANTLARLNRISHIWAAQFEFAPELPLIFTADTSGTLFLNGKALCPIDLVDPDSIFVHLEQFGFYTPVGLRCSLQIEWPYDGHPQVILN